MLKKIYVASSWRNREQPKVVAALRALGHDVYDFKNPPARTGFAWEQTELGRPTTPSMLVEVLRDPIARAGFESDMNALRSCDLCVLVMPAGVSANLELGYAVGAGKHTIVYIPDEAYTTILRPFEPELMWLMCPTIVTTFEELLALPQLTSRDAAAAAVSA